MSRIMDTIYLYDAGDMWEDVSIYGFTSRVNRHQQFTYLNIVH